MGEGRGVGEAQEPAGSDGLRRGRLPLWAYFALLLAVVLAAAAGAAVYVSLQATTDARRDARRDARFAARTAAKELGDGIALLRLTVGRLAANPQIGQVVRNPAGCTLSFAGGGGFSRGHLDIVAPDGRVACSSSAPAGRRAAGYTGADWLRRAQRGPLLLAPVDDRRTGEKSLVAAAPIAGGGVVAAFAELEPVAGNLAARYGGGRPVEFLVTTSDGRTALSRSRKPQRWVGASLAGTPFARADDGFDRRDVEGTPRLYGSATVAGTGWRFFAGEDRGEALAPGDRLRNRELAIIAGGLLLVLAATFLIYRRVAVPIERLGAAVRSSDPYAPDPTPVPAAGPAEIAGLAGDVNDLISSVGRELHHRRELEEQLRHTQKMDALGRVAAGIAHDFNNLVTVIAGFTSLMLKSLQGNESLRAHAEEVGRAAERASVLIRQLLLFSRKEPLRPTRLDANDLVAGMETMLGRLLGAHITLVSRLDAAPATVEADRGQLEQVLMNLAVNARDAMPEGGRLTLRTETAVLDPAAADTLGLEPGEHVRIEVADTGVGMDARTLAHLFEPFFTTKEAGKGTGLGLATCYGIVAELGGAIDVESEPGRGSVFSVYLPRAAEAVVEQPSRDEAQPAGAAGGETILLVEDDAGLRTLAKTVLEDAGYAVLDARFGEEALFVADRHEEPIDLLLTDGVMPVMSGRELATRFATLHPDVRVVYMSGYDRESMAGDDALPPEAFLPKPFTPEALLAKVREALDAPVG